MSHITFLVAAVLECEESAVDCCREREELRRVRRPFGSVEARFKLLVIVEDRVIGLQAIRAAVLCKGRCRDDLQHLKSPLKTIDVQNTFCSDGLNAAVLLSNVCLDFLIQSVLSD
jgi:hypothetical protein